MGTERVEGALWGAEGIWMLHMKLTSRPDGFQCLLGTAPLV